MRSRILIVALVLLVGTDLSAQTRTGTAPLPPLRRSIRIMGGYAWPVSREPWVIYWKSGPAASVEFLSRIAQPLYIGIGGDVQGFWFRSEKFLRLNPGTGLRNLPIALTSIGVIGHLDLTVRRRLTPYLALSVGIGRVSEAVYVETVDSVRVTHFNIPGRTRLACGIAGGLDYLITRRLAVDLEVKGTYFNNDPAVGWFVVGRSGLRFLF
jgi:hypothetical protein